MTIDPAAEGPGIFAGIGPTIDVARYLDGISHDVIRDFELSPDRVLYRRVVGEAAPAPPADQTFWVAQVSTTEPDELTWEVESGDWTVVLMNADGSRAVDLDARLGIKIDWLLPALIGIMALGLVLLAGGTTLIIFGSRGLARQPEPAIAATAAALLNTPSVSTPHVTDHYPTSAVGTRETPSRAHRASGASARTTSGDCPAPNRTPVTTVRMRETAH